MNRIQGAEPNMVRERLSRLWCLGQVSHEEFVALVGEVGRKSLFNAMDNEPAYVKLLSDALYPWERGKQSGSYWPESSVRT